MTFSLNSLYEFEQNFDPKPWILWTGQHIEIPIFAVSLYLLMVFKLPGKLDPKFRINKLRYVIALWNAGLAIFSTIGFWRMTPELITFLQKNTLHDSVCIHVDNYERKQGPGALWLTLFIYSKVPELVDTFWLIIQRKPVIFLHWFHHVVALLYCWNSFMLELTPGAWFAIMNYGAHMFMYTYYCAMSLKLQKYAMPFAPFITTLQILQMVGGIVIILYTATVYARGEVFCNVVPYNLKIGLAMYAIFFYHFCALFNEKYLSKKPKKQTIEMKHSNGMKYVALPGR